MSDSSEQQGKASIVRWVALVAGPIVALIVYLLIPEATYDGDVLVSGLPEAGRKAGGLGAWMAVWWLTEAIPLSATALLPIAAFPLLGVLDLGATTSRYAHPIIFLFMGGFILALAMQRWDLHKRIALVTILLVGSSPARLVGGFMLATGLLSMFVSNTATAVMLVPIGLSVVEMIHHNTPEEEREHVRSLGACLMLAIAYSASIGGIGTLIGTPPNAILAGYVRDEYGRDLGFARWMTLAVPIVAVFMPVAWLYLTRVAFPARLGSIPGGRRFIRSQLEQLGPMSRAEWTVLVVFSLTAALWITRPQLNDLGERFSIGALASLTDTGIAIGAALALFVIPVNIRTHTFAIDWRNASKLPWGILLLFGGGLALAGAMSANGVDVYVGSAFEGMRVLDDSGSVIGWRLLLMIVAISATVIFLTELTSNTAITAALMPVLGGVALTVGVEPMYLLAPAAISASCAFMLPVATPPNAIVFGSGRLSIAQMARAGFWLNLIGIVLISLVCYLLLPALPGLSVGAS